jgi:hypothetical protein
MSQLTREELLEALTKGRELIKMGWIKGAWARNKQDKSVEPWSEDACEFCVEGAILGATHFAPNAEQLASACLYLLQVANPEFTDMRSLTQINKGSAQVPSKIDSGHSLVPRINDSTRTTHKQVIRMFTNAIKLVTQSTWHINEDS